MLSITKDNRLDIENEYMALLLNKPDLFSISQIKAEYLCDDKNKKIFEYSKECYEENECINVYKIAEKHKNFDIDYFVDLLMNELYYNNCWKQQLDLAEESIIKFYKEDVIEKLNYRREKGLCDYDEYVKQVRKLDDIVLTDNSITLTEKEILDGINEQHAKINFNNFTKLNRILEMVRGDFLIIGATTGAGKSSFMLNLMNDLMIGFQCIYFNMEMSKSTIYKRITAIKSGMNLDDINNPKSKYQKEVIEKAIKEIEKSGLIIEHKANDVRQIKTTLMKFKDKNRHTILFIDHLGLTRCDNAKSLYEQATEVAKELRQMCLEYDCTIISASQLNRSAYGTDDLSLSMLKDSGELENSASKVILLQNISDKNIQDKVVDMKINIVKNRDGRIGFIDMKYDKGKQIFKEVVDYDNRN